MPIKNAPLTVDHEVFYQDLIAMIKKHHEKVTSSEMLAIASNVVGKLIALQDRRTMTYDGAMEIVAHNIKLGNMQVVVQLLDKTAGRS